jgi:hypothetical protein
MKELREKHEDLDKIMNEYETYLDENGLPYCDYKLFRNKHLNKTPLEKFKYGVKRIIRIVKSYRSSAFSDLMEKVREKIKSDKNKKENRRRSTIMRSVPMTPEERTQQILIDLVGKVEGLNEKLDRQEKIIKDLKENLEDKIERLKCYENSNDSSIEDNTLTSKTNSLRKSDKKSSKRKKNRGRKGNIKVNIGGFKSPVRQKSMTFSPNSTKTAVYSPIPKPNTKIQMSESLK